MAAEEAAPPHRGRPLGPRKEGKGLFGVAEVSGKLGKYGPFAVSSLSNIPLEKFCLKAGGLLFHERILLDSTTLSLAKKN